MSGPLAVHADGFGAELARLGYTPLSVEGQLRLVAHVSRWLEDKGLGAGDLIGEVVVAFLEARRADGYSSRLSQRGVAPLLEFLRGEGILRASTTTVVSTPLGALVADYRTFLIDERGLTGGTVRVYERVARLFLTERTCAGGGEVRLDGLVAADVAAFVTAECAQRPVASAKTMVTGLRSLLRFLHVTGRGPGPLTAAVPAVAGWRGGSPPRSLPAAQVQAILAGCDRRGLVGSRDYVI